jgi:hypothetical protein
LNQREVFNSAVALTAFLSQRELNCKMYHFTQVKLSKITGQPLKWLLNTDAQVCAGQDLLLHDGLAELLAPPLIQWFQNGVEKLNGLPAVLEASCWPSRCLAQQPDINCPALTKMQSIPAGHPHIPQNTMYFVFSRQV